MEPEPELIVMDEDEEEDDDLVILEERPAPPKPPTDLTMDCVDEPINKAQRMKQAEDVKAFQQTMQLVKKWCIKPRLQTQRRSTIVMGSLGKGPGSSGTSLTRPLQPAQVPMGFRPLNTGHTLINARPGMQFSNNRPPISVVRQRSLGTRGKLIAPLPRPPTTSVSTSQPRSTAPSNVIPPAGATGAITATTAGQPLNSQLALVNGQLVNAQNLQPIFFDATSGVLVVPSSSPAGQNGGTTATVSRLPQIRGAVSITSVRANTNNRPSGPQTRTIVAVQTRPPRVPSSLTPITSGADSFSPRIISTSSLSINNPNARGQRPNTVTVRYPPASQKAGPSSVVRPQPPKIAAPVRAVNPNIASANKPAPQNRSASSTVNRTAAPQPPPPNSRPAQNATTNRIAPHILGRPSLPTPNRPPVIQYAGKPRPGSTVRPATPNSPNQLSRPPSSAPGTQIVVPAGPQMETTNTINGSQADKDSNNNKTFPSLVVVIKPYLGEKVSRQALAAARSDLDTKVKNLLVHSPAKLTEWLMQQGLLRLEHRCVLHMTPDRENIKYKLGMYSDSGKQPFSGGYVWITECCPDTQISVFHGSIFESAVYTPGVIMKLIYHWACQTSAQNVLQWVKVSSYYLKNFYTLLRSCCVAALHEYAPVMGGRDKFVEVGIITLGTPLNQMMPNQKPIKIEIVGVLDPAKNVVRMKVINPLGGATPSTTQTRLQQILWPLKTWVDKESTILIDYSIDKSSLAEMGFKSVVQSKTPSGTGVGTQMTNGNIMNYLKHVIPKMFQNTLSVLSKSLIQQFLDELSWRELWASTSLQAFDNMINHLVQMTKWELDETLISRLNKISLNPFAEWSYSKAMNPTGIDMLPDSIRGAGSGMPTLESYAAYVRSSNGYSSSTSSPAPTSPPASSAMKKKKRLSTENGLTNLPPILLPEISLTNPNSTLKRKVNGLSKEDLRAYLNSKSNDTKNGVNLYGYYYGESKGFDGEVLGAFPTTHKCPLCFKPFLTNQEIIRHIAGHVNNVGRTSSHVVYCEFCLKEIGSQTLYATHLSTAHRLELAANPCLICQESFPNKNSLIIHMWQTHEKCEMPYKCHCCTFRSSRHHEVVEHFNREHAGTDQVQCPICLKVFSIRNAPDIQNVVGHLQSHSGKKGKKCSQCVLTFATDMDVRGHTYSGLHESPRSMANYITLQSAQDKVLLMPLPPKFAKANFTYPPSKKLKGASSSGSSKDAKTKGTAKNQPIHLAHLEKGKICLDAVKFFVPKGEDPNEVYNCCECKHNLTSDDHFPGCLTCSKCPFSTSCEKSMFAHNKNNHQVGRRAKGVGSMHTKVPKLFIQCACGATPENSKALMAHMSSCRKRTGLLRPDEEEFDDAGSPNLTCRDETGLLSGLGLLPKNL